LYYRVFSLEYETFVFPILGYFAFLIFKQIPDFVREVFLHFEYKRERENERESKNLKIDIPVWLSAFISYSGEGFWRKYQKRKTLRSSDRKYFGEFRVL